MPRIKCPLWGLAQFTLATSLILGHSSIASGALWTVTDLNPAGAPTAHAYGVGGSQQVGTAYVRGANRARLWRGAAASWVDLSPAGSSSSGA